MDAVIQIGQYAMPILAILVGAGGLIGFLKAGSRASMISGTVSAILLLACFAITFLNQKAGLISGFVVMTLLEVVFAIRLKKTGKFMPSGMLLALVSIGQILVLLAVLSSFGMI